MKNSEIELSKKSASIPCRLSFFDFFLKIRMLILNELIFKWLNYIG